MASLIKTVKTPGGELFFAEERFTIKIYQRTDESAKQFRKKVIKESKGWVIFSFIVAAVFLSYSLISHPYAKNNPGDIFVDPSSTDPNSTLTDLGGAIVVHGTLALVTICLAIAFGAAFGITAILHRKRIEALSMGHKSALAHMFSKEAFVDYLKSASDEELIEFAEHDLNVFRNRDLIDQIKKTLDKDAPGNILSLRKDLQEKLANLNQKQHEYKKISDVFQGKVRETQNKISESEISEEYLRLLST